MSRPSGVSAGLPGRSSSRATTSSSGVPPTDASSGFFCHSILLPARPATGGSSLSTTRMMPFLQDDASSEYFSSTHFGE